MLLAEDDHEFTLKKGMSCDVPIGTTHRIKSTGTGNLVFIEIQQGDYFGEDDIERLQDDFGRMDRGGN